MSRLVSPSSARRATSRGEYSVKRAAGQPQLARQVGVVDEPSGARRDQGQQARHLGDFADIGDVADAAPKAGRRVGGEPVGAAGVILARDGFREPGNVGQPQVVVSGQWSPLHLESARPDEGADEIVGGAVHLALRIRPERHEGDSTHELLGDVRKELGLS